MTREEAIKIWDARQGFGTGSGHHIVDDFAALGMLKLDQQSKPICERAWVAMNADKMLQLFVCPKDIENVLGAAGLRVIEK